MSENKIGASILVVDDTLKNIQVLGTMLRKEGHQIHVAQNGAQALKVAQTTPLDLILLDILMPIMDGFETCKKLKESPQTKDIPVIFLTAKTESEDIVKGFELGAVDYVTKPFNSTELLARVNTHLSLYKLQKELERLVDERTTELQESEEKYRSLFEYANDSIFIINPSSLRFLDVNDNATKRLGYSREELLQMTVDNLDTPTASPRSEAIIQQLQESGSVIFEHVHRRKDGGEMPVEISSRVVEYGGRKVFQNLVRDISERVRAEQEIRQLNEELEGRVIERTAELHSAQEELVRKEKLATLGQIAGSVAHELRNPLGIIGNSAYYLNMRLGVAPQLTVVIQSKQSKEQKQPWVVALAALVAHKEVELS